MLLEEAFRLFIMSKTEVTSLLGTRLYPVVAPQGTALPFAIYTRIALETQGLLREEGFTVVPIEVTIYGADYLQIKEISHIMRKPPILGSYRGVWSGIPIHFVRCTNEADDYDDEAKGGTGLKMVRTTYEITIAEADD